MANYISVGLLCVQTTQYMTGWVQLPYEPHTDLSIYH